VNGNRAVELKLSQGTASTHEDLKTRFQLPGEFIVLRHTGVDTAVLVLNHPLITGLIFVIGLVALYVEFSFPGTFVGGLIAGLCFAIFFWSRFLGGTAGWLEVILFIGGLTFICMELFVIPGIGIAGITGVLLLIASVVMASQSFVIPHNSRELNTTLTQVGIVGGSGVMFIIAAAIFSRYLGAIPVVKSLMLEVPQTSLAGDAPVGTGLLAASALSSVPVSIGEHGIADSPLRPAGKARFGDRFVDVVSDGVFIDREKPVRVVEIAGNRVVVREAESPRGTV
jgi:membrane-bound serine protease (ClpP class)